jgi:hypothetical protein
LRVGLNVLGVLVIVVGLVLSIPGVPGPGLAVAFIGLTLVDFPGRQRVVRAVLVRPSVRRAIDRLRARFGRAPLVLDASPASPDQRRGKRP